MWSSRCLLLLVIPLLGLAGCGDADSQTSDDPDDVVSGFGVVILEDGPEPNTLGEYADLGEGLRVRLDVEGVGGDEWGPWLTVSMRAENDGPGQQPVPTVELYCEQSDDPGWPWSDEDDMPGREDRIGPGESFEREFNVLIPLDEHRGGPIPECEGEAHLSAATYGEDWNNPLVSADWELPGDIVDELNEARLDAEPSPTIPDEPPKDPDRPYAWVDQDQYTSGYQVVVAPGVTAAEALQVLEPKRRSTSPDDVKRVIVAENADGVVLFTYWFVPEDRVKALSHGGLAASYSNTVNGDDHVLVVRDGKVVRSFDPFLAYDYVKTKPLPQEKGLDLENDTWAASWTLLERLTKIHVTEEWLFEQDHPAYLLKD